MAYKYEHFIPQNTAPSGAKRIAIYNKNGVKVGAIPLGNLTPTTKEKLYSFGLLSDIHLADYIPTTLTRFDDALTFFESKGASFCCHCGDLADYGFWYPTATYEVSSYNPILYEKYREICQKHNISVFGNTGNHESYNGYDISKTYTDIHGADPTLVVNNLEKLQEYTGDGLIFTKTQGNDVFIFVGQSTGGLPMTVEHLQWLYEKLEENRNKRCFVFIHPFISAEDSGNPLGQHSIPLFNYWGEANTQAFISMLSHYKNATLFHGHSHVHFSTQEQVSHAIYSENLGFRSVHVPSLATGRKFENGTLAGKDASYSLGYLVDVYDDCIVLNGWDFINEQYCPLGVYKIDTTLQPVEANTFTDSTGTITV